MHHLMKLGSHRIAAGAGWVLLAAGLWWLVASNVWSRHQPQAGAQAAAQRAAAKDNSKDDDDELKSRFGRALSEALDDEDEGDDDQRDLIRKILKETDEQLVEILDGDPREAIRAANRPLQLPACLTDPCGPPKLTPPGAKAAEAPPQPKSDAPADEPPAAGADEVDAPSL